MTAIDPSEFRALQRRLKNYNLVADKADLFEDGPPEELLAPYPFAWDEVEQARGIQKKYADRAQNIRRSWNRLQLFAPELLRPGAPARDVFEMSTAHGGILEICRHYGHHILGNDWLNFTQGQARGEGAVHRRLGEDVTDREKDDYLLPIPRDGEGLETWAYKPIIEAMDIPMTLFDGGKVPYPLDDKSQDVVFCFQAIEHYCHPGDWSGAVSEFCRIARRSVVILLNKNPRHLADQPDYVAAFERARLGLRNWDRDGFECTSVQMRWQQALGFKLTART